MKRFNFTGRKKILHQDILIRLHGHSGEVPVVDVIVNLTDYGFPNEAEVHLEAHRLTRFERLSLGKVANTVRAHNKVLDEFDDSDGLKFRIKITDGNGGQLLGVAENVKPFNKDNDLDENQKSILPVISRDLSHTGVFWRIDINDEDAVLEIERELGSREQVVRSLLFKGFILPAAMRQILTKILAEGFDEELSDPADFSTRWLLFARQVGAGMPENNNEIDEQWLDDTVRLLANRIGVRDAILEDFEKGVWK